MTEKLSVRFVEFDDDPCSGKCSCSWVRMLSDVDSGIAITGGFLLVAAFCVCCTVGCARAWRLSHGQRHYSRVLSMIRYHYGSFTFRLILSMEPFEDPIYYHRKCITLNRNRRDISMDAGMFQ